MFLILISIQEKLQSHLRQNRTTLFQEGDWGDDMLLILSGRIETTLHSGGKQIRLNNYAAGDAFGEHNLLMSRTTRPYGARVIEDAEVMFLGREDFLRMGRQNKRLAAELAYNLVGVMVTKLRRCILNVYS